MSYIDRLLKKTEIIRAYGFPYNNWVYDSMYIKNILNKRKSSKLKPFPKEITTLVVSYHAFERWNERVGPFMEYHELNILLNQLFLLKNRIEVISDKRGLVDSDIMFYYVMKQDTIYITTFYGRISLHPTLNNIRELKEFLARKKERIDFKIPIQQLRNQYSPPLPIDFIEFQGNTTLYQLEKYKVTSQENSSMFLFYLTERKNKEINTGIEINMLNPNAPLLTKSVLYILKKLGYEQFVKEHLQFHKPEAVQKAIEKYNERLKNKAISS